MQYTISHIVAAPVVLVDGSLCVNVHCTIPIHSDTVSRSGMYCAIATTIERCKTEGVVDVFQVVKALRVQKAGGVLTVVRLLIPMFSYIGLYQRALCLCGLAKHALCPFIATT